MSDHTHNMGFHISENLCQKGITISDNDLIEQSCRIMDIVSHNIHDILKKIKIDYIIVFDNKAKKYFGKLCYMNKYFYGSSEKEIKKQLIKYHIDVLCETKNIMQVNRKLYFRPNRRGL